MTDATYPEVLSDLATQICNVLVSRGTEKKQARDVAAVVTEHVLQHWGGQQIYIPKGLQFKLLIRHQEIFRKWNGHNVVELSREYGVSRQRLYQILKKERQRQRATKP